MATNGAAPRGSVMVYLAALGLVRNVSVDLLITSSLGPLRLSG